MPDERKPETFISFTRELPDSAQHFLTHLHGHAHGWLQLFESHCEPPGTDSDKLQYYLAQTLAGLFEAPGLAEDRAKPAVVPSTFDLKWSFKRLEPIALSEHQRQDLAVVAEQLKTQLIEQRRALLLANKTNDALGKKCDRLLDVVCDLASANKDLQAALIAKHEGRVCLYETHKGVVSAVIGHQVEVTFETKDGPLKQIYHKGQFLPQKVPQEGDPVEAHVMLSTNPQPEHQDQAGGVDQDAEDRPDFRTNNTADTIRI